VAVNAAPARLPAVGELDGLSDDAFIAAVTPLFEGAPRFLRRLAALRPFGDAATLFVRARALALELPQDEAVELVDAHPRLGAPPPTVSALSFAEQGYDRDSPPALGGEAEAAGTGVAGELARLNDAYEARFGFRYCVFVAGRPREALLPGFRAALAADRADELRRALIDVVRIAEDRFRKLRRKAAG